MLKYLFARVKVHWTFGRNSVTYSLNKTSPFSTFPPVNFLLNFRLMFGYFSAAEMWYESRFREHKLLWLHHVNYHRARLHSKTFFQRNKLLDGLFCRRESLLCFHHGRESFERTSGFHAQASSSPVQLLLKLYGHEPTRPSLCFVQWPTQPFECLKDWRFLIGKSFHPFEFLTVTILKQINFITEFSEMYGS